MHKLKKIIISLTLSFLFLFSFSLSVFATITTTQYLGYTQTTYTNESVLPYNFTIGKGGDIYRRSFKNDDFLGFYFDNALVNSICRSSDGSIYQINISFSDYTRYQILTNSSGFNLWEYNLEHSSFTFYLYSYDYNSGSERGYNIDWSKVTISMSCGIKKGDTFTYHNYKGEQVTITFDGEGGVVGYGQGGLDEPDNPLDNLQKQEFPEFNIGQFQGLNFKDYVDFDSIIGSVNGIEDVVYAISQIFPALRGGFAYVTDSVLNVVTYLSSVVVELFKWLQNIFPVLVNNITCDISPILMLIVEAIKANPITEDFFDFDSDGLFTRLDNNNNFLTSFFTEPLKEGLLSLPTLITSIKDTFNDVSSAITVIKDTLDFSFTSTISAIKDKFTDFLTDFTNFTEQLSFFTKDFFDTKDLNLNIYIKDKISNLKDYLVLKIPFFHTIELIKQSISNMQDSGSVIFTFSAVTLPFGRGEGQAVFIPEFPVTIDIVNVIRKYTDPIIIGICYLSSFIFFKQKIPEIFGGVGGAVAQSLPTENNHIGL